MLGHYLNLNRFKRIDIIQNIVSDHNEMKLGINNIKETKKLTKLCKLNNTLSNNWWIKEEITRGTRRKLRNEKGTYIIPKVMRHRESSDNRIFIAVHAYIKKREISKINNLTLQLKELGKEEQTKHKASRRKQIKF